MTNNKTILVTGGAGYVGSTLVPYLLKKGYHVAILDIFLYGRESLSDVIDQIDIYEIDLLKADYQDLFNLLKNNKIDGIIHLAGASKEPSATISNRYVLELNYLATKNLAKAAKAASIKKFVFASTCSVYFSYSLPKISPGNELWEIEKELPQKKETDEINPISPYSISKRACEEFLLSLADENFTPIILRKGTIFGLSPRMRFDLVLNALVKTSFFNNKMTVLQDIYRPLVDVKTVAQAYEQALHLDRPDIINVVDLNISLPELAQKIAEILQIKPEIEIRKVDVERNYRASAEKFNQMFKIERRPLDVAVKEIWDFLEKNPEDKPIYYNQKYEGAFS